MAIVASLKIRRYMADALTVVWELAEIQQADPLPVDISRCESPDGPFEKVASGLSNVTTYNDYKALVGDISKKYWYVVSGIDDGVAFSSAPTSCENPLDATANYVIGENDLLLKYRCGYPVLFFLKRTYGTVCPYCGRRGMANSSSCEACFGTGLLGGYWEGMEGYVGRDRRQQGFQPLPGAEFGQDMRRCWTGPFPELRTSDIFVDSENTRWLIIGDVTATYRLERTVRQFFTARRIAPGDVLYKLPVHTLWDLVPLRGHHVWRRRHNG